MIYRNVLFCLLASVWRVWMLPLIAQPANANIESYINDHVQRYPLSEDNLLRISAFVELKGDFASGEVVSLDFGGGQTLSFYPNNCLLKVPGYQVYHLTSEEGLEATAEALDEALSQVFEQIDLMSNGEASKAHIELVDKSLARKDLDPFHKLYVRYLLLHHGNYDENLNEVVLYSEWLDRAEDRERLSLKLTETEVRGYFHRTGGEVYVRDVDRAVEYATGEEMGENVGPFKLFLQKMLSFHTQYLSASTKTSYRRVALGPGKRLELQQSNIEPLYHEYSWIPMMLGILRSRDLNFGDPDIVRYFVDEPYFKRIYDQLLPEEKTLTDRFLRKNGFKAS